MRHEMAETPDPDLALDQASPYAAGAIAGPAAGAASGRSVATRAASRGATWALVALLLVAAGLRLSHINWDQGQHVHPDERWIVWVADTVHWPGSLSAALDPAVSPLNPLRWPPGSGQLTGLPRDYSYGHFPLYLLLVIAHAAAWVATHLLGSLPAVAAAGAHLAEYQSLPLAGRAISGLCDLGTLLLVYALGRRLYGRRAGLLAAGAYTFAVLAIQLSHFYAVDMLLTLCTTATVYLAVAAAEQAGSRADGAIAADRVWPWVAVGAAAGLAVGSKFSAVLLAAPIAVAALYGLPATTWPRQMVAWLRRVSIVLLAGLIVFVITNPFALLDYQLFVRALTGQNAMITGRMDAPYTRQFIGTLPLWYDFRQLSQWGLGWPLGLAGFAGLAWASVAAVRRRATPGVTIAVAWALPYFAVTASFYAKFLRYMAPLVPFLLVFAAGGAVALYRRWNGKGRRVLWAAGGLTAVFTVAWVLAFSSIYTQEHPWVQASRWIYQNIPANSKLLSEVWDDALPLTLIGAPDRPPQVGYRWDGMPLWDVDTAAKLDTLVNQLSSADYVTLATSRLSAPIQRLSSRYPMSSRYYALLFSGKLGYTLVADFSDYPHLGPLQIVDSHADESFWVYDHPHALIFANTGHFSAAELRALLSKRPAAESYLPDGPNPLTPFPTREGGTGSQDAFLASIVQVVSLPGAEAAGLKEQSPSGAGDDAETTGQPARASSFERRALAQRLLHATGQPVPPSRLGKGVRGLGQAGQIQQTAWRSSPGISSANSVRVASPREAKAASSKPAASQAPPAQAGQPSLLLGRPVDTLPVVADFRWNGLASAWPPLAVVLWWLAVSVFGWAAWPLLFRWLGGLPDRGYGLSRMIGWLVIGWIHWLAVSLGLWQNRLAPIAILLALLVVAGAVAARAQRRRLAAFFARQSRLLLIEEALFAAAFLAFVGIRLLDPDLWQPWNGGEKFMEFAFLNATLRSAQFPPYDPYFAGGTINYYYYGLYLVSLPIKLTGIAPEVAFNLAVPGLFAQTALALFAVAAALASRARHALRSGLLAVLFGVVLSNLWSANKLLDQLAALGKGTGLLASVRGLAALLTGAATWPGFDYWGASRVIPNTINEFPFWSFLFADLHPHLIAMPIGVTAAGLAVNWLLLYGSNAEHGGESERPVSAWPALGRAAVRLSLIVVVLGSLGPANTWDLPVYALLVAGALFFAAWRRRRLIQVLAALGASAAVAGLAVLIFRPFYTHYQPELGHTGSLLSRYLAPVSAASPLREWLYIWGVFLFLALSYTLYVLSRRRPARVAPAVTAETAFQPVPVAEAVTLRAQEAGTAGVAPAGRGAAAYEDADSAGGDGVGLAAGQVHGPATALPPELPVPDERSESENLRTRQPAGGPDDADAPGPVVRSPRLVALLVLLGVALVVAALGRRTAALVVLPLGLASGLLFRRRSPRRMTATLLLLAVGLGVVAGIELVYLRDFLEGGDWYRMNTVFKFAMPAWLLLSLALAAALPTLWRRAARLPVWLAAVWRTVVVVSIVAGLAFVPFGVQARVDDRFPGARPSLGTLDGMAFMTVGSYAWPDENHVIKLAADYQAIRWLLDHVQGSPVIAEAPAGSYQVNGQSQPFDYYRAGGLRVASLTGFPTFVGQHQYEQRDGGQVSQRTALGQEFFETTDLGRTRRLIGDLHVDYVYVSTLERILFTPESLAKFDTLAASGELQVVYHNASVTIYHVAR